MQRLKDQLMRKAGTEERREHTEREAVELDIMLDRRDGQRPEQQERENYKGGCVIHKMRANYYHARASMSPTSHCPRRG